MSPTPSLLALRSFPAFEELSDTELLRLAQKMRLCSYPKKSVVVRQGEPSNHIYFLVSGFVKITRGGSLDQPVSEEHRSHQRKEVAIAILGPGHMLGELASLAETRRSASVITISDCNLIELEHTAFIECLERNPSVALFIIRYLAQRLVESNRQVELLRGNVETRIAGLFRKLENSGLPQDVFPSNAEIGRMVGASREMVSKVVGKMATKSLACEVEVAAPWQ